MQITPIKSNMTEVVFSNGLTILLSYQTPVAGHYCGQQFKTSKKWSVTTSKHINQWLADSANAVEVPQGAFFDLLDVDLDCSTFLATVAEQAQ